MPVRVITGNALDNLGDAAGTLPQGPLLNTLQRLGVNRQYAQTVPLGRSRFVDELANPAVRDRLIAYTNAEVGGQGPRAQQAFIESIFNRAVARNQPLATTLSGSYFPAVTHQRAARGVGDAQRLNYTPLINDVLGGSNISNYATGNASGTVGFAGGPQTFAAGGERYGVEGPDRGWWTKVGAEGPAGGVGYVNPSQVPTGATTDPRDLVRPSEGFNVGRFLQGFDFTPARAPAVTPPALGAPPAFRFAPLGQRR